MLHETHFLAVLLTLLISQSWAADNHSITEKRILGWIENVYLMPSKVKLKAKLDTGAKTSSIHAQNIELFTKDKTRWVRFDIPLNSHHRSAANQNHQSDSLHFELPVLRTVKIKRHKRTSLQRAVVELPIFFAGRAHKAQFNLTDRKKFIYPVLMGRRFLKKVAVVDPSNTFVAWETPPGYQEANTKIKK